MVSLSATNHDLIGRCLWAAAEGPCFDDWEFHTLLGLDRHVVRTVADRWPTEAVDAETEQAVSQSIAQLWGYPHGREHQLLRELNLENRDGLRSLLDRWRRSRPGA